ncbi:somatostatin receptor type 2-like [Diadema antillarum]|uniref:somatostatin receptor type 2-like n=1 Tax=Diadema antillarum TaxID=105358 RepID=UPI003A83B143
MKYNNMKTIPNIYILNLAIMDFMFVLTLPFQGVQASSLHWPFGRLMCKLVTGYDSVNMFASVFTLSFMSVDRYVAVVYPISSIRYRTKTKTRIFCCLVWFSAILLALPSWLYQDIDESGEHCYTANIKTDAEVYFYCYFNVMLGFILPLLVILTAYTALLYKMLRSNLPLRSDGASAAQRASKRVSILTISVIVVFFICWMPYHAMQIAFAIDVPKSKALRVSYSFIVCWCYSNSCFNPLVYTFIGENFKKNLADMCPWCFPRASKFDRNRGGRESSTYTRGGTMRLNNVHYNEYTSPTVAPSTTVGSDGCNNDHSPKMQTYTFTT